jgi:DNA-binding transcriptional LysR family regulator
MVAGSTVEAAALLNISQPAVSRLIKNLEETTEYRLFVRQHGRMFPTDEARFLLDQLMPLFESIQHVETTLQNIRPSDDRQLRIVASTPTAQRFLPEVIAAFRADNPQVGVSLGIVVKRETARVLERQQFDVALLAFPMDYPEVHTERFGRVAGVCALPPGHRLAALDSVSAPDLEHENFISIAPDTILRMRVDGLFNAAGVVRRKLDVETQSAASICQMVAAGVGVSVIDPFTAAAFMGRNIILRPFTPAVTFEYGIVLPINRTVSSHTEAFVASVRAHAKRFLKGIDWRAGDPDGQG